MNTNSTSTTSNTISTTTSPRQLERLDGKLGGVAAGLSDYFDVDVNAIRIGLIALTVLGGFPAIPIVYLAAWALVPERTPVMPPAPTASDRVVIPVEVEEESLSGTPA